MMQKARDKLRELRALHDDGLLSEQEFERRKNAILDAEYAPPGAAPVSAPLPVRQGTELGFMTGQEIGPQNRRYRLERLIGMGGMGQVWQATDLATHAELGHSEMVALKILPPQLTQSATHAKLLIEEATQARKLAHEMASVEGGLLKRMKAVIDDGLALPLPEALKMEIERGSKNNSAVTPEAAEASRKTAMERGREQTS